MQQSRTFVKVFLLINFVSLSHPKFKAEDLAKFPQFYQFLDAFRENSTVETAIEKVDQLISLMSSVLDYAQLVKTMSREFIRDVCKLYPFQVFLYARGQRALEIITAMLADSGYLAIPFNASRINNIQFADSHAAFRKLVGFNINYMRNTVLKFDDPRKTGLSRRLLRAEAGNTDRPISPYSIPWAEV